MRNRDDDEEETKKIILIEDIDCIFQDRKDGDSLKNKINITGFIKLFRWFYKFRRFFNVYNSK